MIDIRELANDNDGVNHLLVIIDVFTRKLWVYPLQNKQGMTVKNALQNWINSLQIKPKVFSTDKGGEFWNQHVRALLRSNNIDQQQAVGTSKASYAERVNKTLQILIYKYLTDAQSTRYIDKLPLLVSSYNSRGHRGLEFLSPNEAEQPRNQRRVRGIAVSRFAKIKRKSPKFSVGNMVRIKSDSKAIHPDRRAYAQQFRGEYFLIDQVNDTLPIPLYYLKSMDRQDLIDGGFYAEELQRVRGDTFKIERVIRWRRRNGTREGLVRWKYFGPQWDSWVKEADIVNIN